MFTQITGLSIVKVTYENCRPSSAVLLDLSWSGDPACERQRGTPWMCCGTEADRGWAATHYPPTHGSSHQTPGSTINVHALHFIIIMRHLLKEGWLFWISICICLLLFFSVSYHPRPDALSRKTQNLYCHVIFSFYLGLPLPRFTWREGTEESIGILLHHQSSSSTVWVPLLMLAQIKTFSRKCNLTKEHGPSLFLYLVL